MTFVALPEGPERLERFPSGRGPPGVRVDGGDGAALAELGPRQRHSADPHQPLPVVLLNVVQCVRVCCYMDFRDNLRKLCGFICSVFLL